MPNVKSKYKQQNKRKRENPNAQQQARRNATAAVSNAAKQVKRAANAVQKNNTPKSTPARQTQTVSRGGNRVQTPSRVQTVRNNNSARVAQRNTGRIQLPKQNATSTTTSSNRNIQSAEDRMKKFMGNRNQQAMQDRREHRQVQDNSSLRFNRNDPGVKTAAGIGQDWGGGVVSGVGMHLSAGTGPSNTNKTVAHRLGMNTVQRKGSNDRRTAEDLERNRVQKERLADDSYRITKKAYEGGIDTVENKITKPAGYAMIKKGNKWQESGQRKLGEVRETIDSKAGRKAYDFGVVAAETMLDMGAGMLTGSAMVPMYLRSAGSEHNSAIRAGATESQARQSAVTHGMIEAMTEKIASVAKPFKSAYGEGVLDDLLERSVKKATVRFGDNAKGTAIRVGANTATSIISEALEEMVAEGLEQETANQIYLNIIGEGKRKDITKSIKQQALPYLEDAEEISKKYNIPEKKAREIYAKSLSSPAVIKSMKDNLIAQGVPEDEARSIAALYRQYNKQILLGSKDASKTRKKLMEEIYALSPVERASIFSNEPWNDREQAVKDILGAGAAGGLLGGLLGGPSHAIEEYSANEKAPEITGMYGKDGLNNLLKQAKASDNEKDASYASAIEENVHSGKGAAGVQIQELHESVKRQEARDKKRQAAENKIIDKYRENKIPIRDYSYFRGEDSNGMMNIPYRKSVQEKHDQVFETAMSRAGDIEDNITERQKVQTAAAVAKVEVGDATAEDINMFTLSNPEARAVYEAVTGDILPDTNEKTRDFLFAKATANYKNSLDLATAEYNNNSIGEMMELTARNNYTNEAQVALSQILGVDMQNPNQTIDDSITKQREADAFNHYYQFARFNASQERTDAEYEILAQSDSLYKKVPAEIKKMAFELGSAEAEKYGRNESENAPYISVETEEPVGFDTMQVAVGMNKLFGNSYKGIKFVSYIGADGTIKNTREEMTDEDWKANKQGFYDPQTGEFVISANASDPIQYILTHELDHLLEKINPEAYIQYRDVVKNALKENGLYDEIIERYRNLYENVGSYKNKKTDEEKEDYLISEYMADNAVNILKSKELQNAIAEKAPDMLDTIHKAIQEIILRLKELLTNFSFSAAQRGNIYEKIGVMEEVADVYADLIMSVAQKNLETQREEYNKEKETEEQSETEEKKFSLSKSVENVNNLIATHNITEQNIINANEMGGFIAPSLAVTKDNRAIGNFGGITLLFNKDSIDPELNEDTYIFDRDAFTPMVSRLMYEIDDGVADELYEAMASKAGNDEELKDDLRMLLNHNLIERTVSAGNGVVQLMNIYAKNEKAISELYKVNHKKEKGQPNTKDIRAWLDAEFGDIFNRLVAGKTFTDGTPVTAEEALERAKAKPIASSPTAKNFKSIDEVRENKVRLKDGGRNLFGTQDYFEAKTMRNVPFSEIKAAVVPYGTSQQVLDILAEYNIPVYMYDETDNYKSDEALANRREVVNSAANEQEVRFSISPEMDEEYIKAVEDGDMEKAQEMVDKAAKLSGYIPESDYQGTSAFNGPAPVANEWFTTPEERKEAFDNGEFDGDQTLADYVDNGLDMADLEFTLKDPRARNRSEFNDESIRNINKAINSGKGTIKMYRSVPVDVKENNFRNGDWVTPSRNYAIDNAEIHGWGEDGEYRIIEQEVPMDNIWWDGNDINEWGYDDGNEYVYKNTENNIKIPAVTYDDDGNVIPLSERFNPENDDRRYSTGGTAAIGADIDGMTKAEQMYDRGLMSAKEIKEMTGYSVGPDGKARFKFSSADMKIIVDRKRFKTIASNNEKWLPRYDVLNVSDVMYGNSYYTLDDVIEWPELFQYYPDAADIRVVPVTKKQMAQIAGATTTACYIEKQNGVKANTIIVLANKPRKLNMSTDDYYSGLQLSTLRASLIHEIQHYIQQVEGFDGGASSSIWNTIRKNIKNALKNWTTGKEQGELLKRENELKEHHQEGYNDSSIAYWDTLGEWEAREAELDRNRTQDELDKNPDIDEETLSEEEKNLLPVNDNLLVLDKYKDFIGNGKYARYSVRQEKVPSYDEVINEMLDDAQEYKSDGNLLPVIGGSQVDALSAKTEKTDYFGELAEKYSKGVDKTTELNQKELKQNIIKLVKNARYASTDSAVYRTALVERGIDAVNEIRSKMMSGDLDAISDIAYDAGRYIVDNSRMVMSPEYDMYLLLRNYFEKNAIKIPEEYDENSFNEFQKRNLGRIVFDSDGVPIEQVWEELSKAMPKVFRKSVTRADEMLKVIEKQMDIVKPFAEAMTSTETNGLIENIGSDLIQIAAGNNETWEPADNKVESYKEKSNAVKYALENAQVEASKASKMPTTNSNGRPRKYVNKGLPSKAMRDEIANDMYNIYMLILDPPDGIPKNFYKPVSDFIILLDPDSEVAKKLEERYGPVTDGVDGSGKTWTGRIAAFEEMMKANDGFITHGFELNDVFFGDLSQLKQSKKIQSMNLDDFSKSQLEIISRDIKMLAHSIEYENKPYSEYAQYGPREAAGMIIDECNEKIGYENHDEIVKKNNSAMGSLVSAYDLFGAIGGTLNKQFLALMDAQNQYIRQQEYIKLELEKIKETVSKKKQKKWRTTIEDIELHDGTVARMTGSQKMLVYILAQRKEAMKHINKDYGGGGIDVIDPSGMHKLHKFIYGKNNKNNSIVYHTNTADIEKICNSLSSEQKDIANKLATLLQNVPTKWMNDTWEKIWGVKRFTTKNYFPMVVSKDYYNDRFNLIGDVLAEDKKPTTKSPVTNPAFASKANDERTSGGGEPVVVIDETTGETVTYETNEAEKTNEEQVKYAPLVIDDMYEMTSRQLDKMSEFAAFAAPLKDMFRLMNMQLTNNGKELSVNVQAAIRNACGDKALDLIREAMEYWNHTGRRNKTDLDVLLDRLITNFKKAKVGANDRVAIQQITAVNRAYMLMEYKYLNHIIKFRKFFKSGRTVREMQSYCELAKWKSWGYSDSGMAHSNEDILMGEEWGVVDTFSMRPYTWLDLKAWSMVWEAVKREVSDKTSHRFGSDEYWKAVNKRFTYIINRTQVVDSQFTRSMIMLRDDKLIKTMTSFMSEPFKTFNLYYRQIQHGLSLKRQGKKKEGNHVIANARAVVLYNGIIVTSAASAVSALRAIAKEMLDGDDDDKGASAKLSYAVLDLFDVDPEKADFRQEFLESFINDIWGNTSPLMMMPVVRDLPSMLSGFEPQNISMSGFYYMIQSMTDIFNPNKTIRKKVEKFVDAFSTVSGIPLSNVWKAMKDGYVLMYSFASASTGEEEEKAEAKKSFFSKIGSVFDHDDEEDETTFSTIKKNWGTDPEIVGEVKDINSVQQAEEENAYEKKREEYELEEHKFWNKIFGDEYGEDGLIKTKNGSKLDNWLNKHDIALTDKEKRQKKYIAELNDIIETAAKRKSGDVNERLWSVISSANEGHFKKGFTDLLEDGNYEQILEMRGMFVDAGGDKKWLNKMLRKKIRDGKSSDGRPILRKMAYEGDFSKVEKIKSFYRAVGGTAETFDEVMTKKTIDAYKKTIGKEWKADAREQMVLYLNEQGMSDASISRNIICKSDTAKEFKENCMLRKWPEAVDSLRILIDAGITEQDIRYLYETRNKYVRKDKFADGMYVYPADQQYTISSPFGHRSSPGGIGSTDHQGVDIAMPYGTNVRAVDGGKIEFAGSNGGYGNLVIVDHGNGTKTFYAHLSKFLLGKGDFVQKGDYIGQVGSTGNSTGPHLHLGFNINGEFVDPREYIDL